jgi:23S rRNA (cytidine1920-2'-O)/16S rRNA (cytidine1409-2'-O)-methyltransferase
MKKERLDKLLVDRKILESREKAKRYIMANLVIVDGIKINKAGTRCNVDSELVIERDENQYVSRGGLKLEKALQEFNLSVKDMIVIDVGASTGGFTDCLLQHGAKKVYCIDVGYGQLDWTLRHDNRIVNMEKTNIRALTEDKFEVKFDLATVDVSFISLTKVLPVIERLLKPLGKVVALVKPQFEAGRENVKKGGIVDDPTIHQEIIANLIREMQKIFYFVDMTFSPIKNSPGNIEYLVYLTRNHIRNQEKDFSMDIKLINNKVVEAHQYFFKNNQ